jgi:hypothetical protein
LKAAALRLRVVIKAPAGDSRSVNISDNTLSSPSTAAEEAFLFLAAGGILVIQESGHGSIHFIYHLSFGVDYGISFRGIKPRHDFAHQPALPSQPVEVLVDAVQLLGRTAASADLEAGTVVLRSASVHFLAFSAAGQVIVIEDV